MNVPTYAKTLTRRYMLAVFLIAATVISGFFTVHFQIEQNYQQAEIINISGRQRMLSQRISFFSNNLATYPQSTQSAKYAEKLQESITLMDETHQRLSDDAKKVQASKTLKDIYFSAPENTDEKVTAFIKNAETFLADYKDAVSSQLPEKMDVLTDHSGLKHIISHGPNDVLHALNEAVLQYQHETEDKIRQFQLIETIIVGFALFVLLLEVIFIFRPMTAEVVKWLGISEDARKKAEDANRLKAEFLSNMSHEIRTPLNGIVGSSELLKKTDITEKQRKYLDAIVESGSSLLSLINDILDFSKIEAGEMQLNPEAVSIKRLIVDLCSGFLPQAQNKNIDLQKEFIGNVPDLIFADGTRLRQIIVNLVGNALKFTEKGTVKISVEALEAQDNNVTLKISVEDTGIGIQEDKLERIFKKFEQADGSITKCYGGTGLGLSISRRLARLMQSEIEVESKLGVGSTFYFVVNLPIEKQATEGAAASENKTELAQVFAGINFLLVENEMVNQMVMTDMLEAMGAKIDLAENGQEALDILEENHAKYNVILMDCMMPVMDGYEATKQIRLREKDWGKNQTIVAITANAMANERKQCFAVGMNDYIPKPVTEKSMYKVLKKYI